MTIRVTISDAQLTFNDTQCGTPSDAYGWAGTGRSSKWRLLSGGYAIELALHGGLVVRTQQASELVECVKRPR